MARGDNLIPAFRIESVFATKLTVHGQIAVWLAGSKREGLMSKDHEVGARLARTPKVMSRL